MEILHIDPGKHTGAAAVSELQGASKVQTNIVTPRESGL